MAKIVTKAMDDMTDVVTDALTDDEAMNIALARYAETDSESNNGSDVDTETEPIEIPSPKTNLVSIEAPSLRSMIMEWTWNSYPEPQVVDRILRFEEEDMDEMYSCLLYTSPSPRDS